ncbi:MAG TPA: hypothetical protein V6D43_03135 [Candidatus Sericytochromatia bacterium]
MIVPSSGVDVITLGWEQGLAIAIRLLYFGQSTIPIANLWRSGN